MKQEKHYGKEIKVCVTCTVDDVDYKTVQYVCTIDDMNDALSLCAEDIKKSLAVNGKERE